MAGRVGFWVDTKIFRGEIKSDSDSRKRLPRTSNLDLGVFRGTSLIRNRPPPPRTVIGA